MLYSIYCEDLKIAQESGSFLQLNYLLEYDSTILITVLYIFFFFKKIYWSTVALQCCASFHCTAK